MTQATTSDQDFVDSFDGPVIEPIKVRVRDTNAPGGFRIEAFDAKFARADLDYWEAWANQLRDARKRERLGELAKLAALDPLVRIEAQSRIARSEVQIFEVLDQQYTPTGIKKILDDALIRAGEDNGARRKMIMDAIGRSPGRAQLLASEICSEPKATIAELRESARKLAVKLGTDPRVVMNWNDDELLAFANNYTPPPPPPPAATGGVVDADTFNAAGGAANPPGGDVAAPSPESTGERETPLSAGSSASNPGA